MALTAPSRRENRNTAQRRTADSSMAHTRRMFDEIGRFIIGLMGDHAIVGEWIDGFIRGTKRCSIICVLKMKAPSKHLTTSPHTLFVFG